MIVERPETRPSEIDPLELIPTLPAEPVNDRDVLLRAAEVVEKRGWQKGAWGEVEHGPVCFLGAIGVAMIELGVAPWFCPDCPSMASMYFRDGHQEMKTINYDELWEWNDRLRAALRPSRRPKATVARALRRLADGATWAEATA